MKHPLPGRTRIVASNRNEYMRKWGALNPDRVKRYGERRRYGLEEGEEDSLLAFQEGSCGICKKALESRYHKDHDHGSNVLRGLLCVKCNMVLGMAGDSIELLLSAISYLKTPPAQAWRDERAEDGLV